MESITIGLLGCGNMGGAIVAGALGSGFLKPSDVFVFDLDKKKLAAFCKEHSVTAAESQQELGEKCGILLLAVKPNVVEGAVKAFGKALSDKAVISIALGWSTEKFLKILPKGGRVLSVMPNTPCMVGHGMTLFEKGDSLLADERDYAVNLFSSIGEVADIAPGLMGIAGSLSGCGPAFMYVILEALADGAVMHGLPRDIAYALAAQTMSGSGEMLKLSGEHPGRLKDNVCSPGGSTIRGVYALEEGSVRAAFINAIDMAYKKSAEVSK